MRSEPSPRLLSGSGLVGPLFPARRPSGPPPPILLPSAEQPNRNAPRAPNSHTCSPDAATRPAVPSSRPAAAKPQPETSTWGDSAPSPSKIPDCGRPFTPLGLASERVPRTPKCSTTRGRASQASLGAGKSGKNEPESRRGRPSRRPAGRGRAKARRCVRAARPAAPRHAPPAGRPMVQRHTKVKQRARLGSDAGLCQRTAPPRPPPLLPSRALRSLPLLPGLSAEERMKRKGNCPPPPPGPSRLLPTPAAAAAAAATHPSIPGDPRT